MSMALNSSPAPRRAYAMALLSRGVPLSLLFDLVLGPRSRELLDVERITAPVPVQRLGESSPVSFRAAG